MVDNIEVDPDTGDLWVGCHPIAFRALDWMLNAFGLTLPSQVFICRHNSVYVDLNVQPAFLPKTCPVEHFNK
jgi:hypothetical protein